MNEVVRPPLATVLAAIATTRVSEASIRKLSEAVGAGQAMLFVRSRENDLLQPAPGFSTHPFDAKALEDFLSACVHAGKHRGSLPRTSEKPAEFAGLSCEGRVVLMLGEPVPDEAILEELAQLFPLLVAAIAPADDRSPPGLLDELSLAQRELQRLREEATTAAVKKDEFLAALSHELRTPLNPVLLIASEAAENSKLTRAVRDDFATIARNAEIEARLIDDLLDLTRITRGKMSLDKRAVDLRDVLRDAIATVRARLDTKKIEFTPSLCLHPHPVFGDSARLQQVFWNLLKNAVKFTAEGGFIRVTSEIDEAAQQIVIHVTDNGLPLSDADARRVFEPAPHADSGPVSGRHRAGGLGVGMTISRMLVELHGGLIEAASRAPEPGAIFTVKLPLAPHNRPASTYAPFEIVTKSPIPETPLRVLLVEDHEPTSLVVARLLKRRGFIVVCAASVASALSAAEKHAFDFVVSDIGLPDGDGYALMTELQSRRELPGIAVSGYGMLEDIGRSEAAGFIAHITKPVSIRTLEAALDLVLPAVRQKRG